jgi:phosphate uptake regulator
MRRKVMLHGPSTLTVSLPNKWAKANNVKKGDEINILDLGFVLQVQPDEKLLAPRKTTLDLSGLDNESTHAILSMIHKSGYDEIELKVKSQDTVAFVQSKISAMFMGYEIIEQKGTHLVIKNVSGDHLSELDNLIRRSFLVAQSLATSSYDAISQGQIKKVDEFLVQENTVNKLTNYCERLLNKQAHKTEKTIYTYLIVWLLESICDDYVSVINFTTDKKFNPKGKLSKIALLKYEEINLFLEEYYKLYYSYSDASMMQLRNKIRQQKESINWNKVPEEEKYIFSIFIVMLNRLSDCLGATSGLHH